MGWCLIAWSLDWIQMLHIAEAGLALGAVIFVHELGHFAVAKMCGVKCEKFYLGFDIYGLKLCKFRWGETEYGIGILPLGGYVKMLGQEDNPGALTEEIERAKLSTADNPQALAAASSALFDPRSYLAKSVPQRMAIISAGVIMNVIFAFAVALTAFWIGVQTTPCQVSELMPGEAAWRAGLRPGDRVARLGGIESPKFSDLQTRVMLGNLKQGIAVEIERPGIEDRLSLRIFPDAYTNGKRPYPMIGILGPRTTRLHAEKPAAAHSAASRANPPLASGDDIVAVDGEPVTNYRELVAHLADRADRPVAVTVRRRTAPRSTGADADLPAGAGTSKQGAVDGAAVEELTSQIAPNPWQTLGIEMTLGPIRAVQLDSPAAAAGLAEGDRIVAIDGAPVGDPESLPERARAAGAREFRLTIERDTKSPDNSVSREVLLVGRPAPWFETPLVEEHPLTVPAWGVALAVECRVSRIDPQGPAAEAGLAPGDVVQSAKVIPGPAGPGEEAGPPEIEIALGDAADNWPYLCALIQNTRPGTQVELHVRDKPAITIRAMASATRFNPDRGLILAELSELRQATSWGEAVALARHQLVDSVMQVYLVIHNIVFKRQVSPKVLGGPVRIAAAAGMSASKGISDLLIFLSLLSANLAVVNFLPIPLLDGGHMVFLTWEGLRGKPASDRVILAFHYAGLCLILSLMLWVLFQDAKWLGGWAGG